MNEHTAATPFATSDAGRTVLNVAIASISDKRSAQDDPAGNLLADLVTQAGHRVVRRAVSPENKFEVRRILSDWIADGEVDVVLTAGGTGFADKNTTPEAVRVLFDKEIEGFGELFRQVSYAEIGGAAIQSRAIAGYANRTVIFCVPASSHACRTAWEYLIRDQLDSGQKPCNFANKVGALPPRKELAP